MGSDECDQRNCDADSLSLQRHAAIERLTGAKLFWASLKNEAERERKLRQVKVDSPEEFIDWLVQADATQAQQAMWVIRRALGKPAASGEDRTAATDAAIASYLLAACRWVSGGLTLRPDEKLISVESASHLACAVISTALFGGQLRLESSERPDEPRPTFTFDVRLPSGDARHLLFERALYLAAFRGARTEAEDALLDDGLGRQQLADLKAHINNIREVEQCALTLVIDSPQAFRESEFARAMDLHAFHCDQSISTALLGMSAEELVAEIKQLWTLVAATKRDSSASAGSERLPAKENAVPGISITVNAPENSAIAVSTGSNSPAQAKVHHVHNAATDWADVLPRLQAFLVAIAETPPSKRPDELEVKTKELIAVAQDPSPERKGRFRQGLEDIKLISEVADGGGKLYELVTQLAIFAAPLLSKL